MQKAAKCLLTWARSSITRVSLLPAPAAATARAQSAPAKMVFAIILKLSPSPKPQLDQPAHGSLAANIHAFGRRFKLASINSRADPDLGLGVAHSNNDCAD